MNAWGWAWEIPDSTTLMKTILFSSGVYGQAQREQPGLTAHQGCRARIGSAAQPSRRTATAPRSLSPPTKLTTRDAPRSMRRRLDPFSGEAHRLARPARNIGTLLIRLRNGAHPSSVRVHCGAMFGPCSRPILRRFPARSIVSCQRPPAAGRIFRFRRDASRDAHRLPRNSPGEDGSIDPGTRDEA
jgi:hypothetical protein